MDGEGGGEWRSAAVVGRVARKRPKKTSSSPLRGAGEGSISGSGKIRSSNFLLRSIAFLEREREN